MHLQKLQHIYCCNVKFCLTNIYIVVVITPAPPIPQPPPPPPQHHIHPTHQTNNNAQQPNTNHTMPHQNTSSSMLSSHLIDPKNDILFKLMFGRECNKDLTLHLLNSVLEGIIEPIEDIEYLQSEKEAGIIVPGSARVDLNCITTQKHKFTAEM